MNRLVKSAVAVALATLPAAGAWALTPAQVAVLPATNIIYLAGSTATDNALKALAELDSTVDPNALFVKGSFDLYTTASGYILTGKLNSGSAAGQSVAIAKQTKGGSAVGIHNVAAGVAPAGMPDLTNPANFNLTTAGGTCAAAVPQTPAPPLTAYNLYTCTQAESLTIVPNGGISDVDPQTFVGVGGVTAADAAALTSSAAVDVPFGVIVNVDLRNRLQTDEGLVSGSETLANVPSLTSAQLRAILSGQMSTLGDLYVFNPTTGKTTQVDGTGSFLHVCRRGNTSGTQIATNIKFFGQGCSKGLGVGGEHTPDDISTVQSGESFATVPNANGYNPESDSFFAGAGTSDVIKCVSAAIDGPPLFPNDTDTVNDRIGVVSTDQVPTTAWRYIAIDGVAPTIWNIQLGAYDFITEDAFNYTPTSIAMNGGGGIHQAIFQTLQAELSNVNALAGLNLPTQNAAASADTSNGGADTGIVTLANSVLYGPNDTAGPSTAATPAWPKAIRQFNLAGAGPNNPLAKTYPSSSENNCNGAYQADPTG